MTKTRGLYLTPIYPPVMGGAAVHFEQITSALQGGPIDQAIVLTAYHSDSDVIATDEEGRIVIRALIPSGQINDGCRKLRLGYNYLFVALFVAFAVLFLRVSVVHTQTKRYYEWGCTVAKKLGATVIIDGQDQGAPSFDATGDVFVAVAQNVVTRAGDRPEEVVEIPVGIDPDSYPTIDPSCRPVGGEYLLFVGDIVERKGVDSLVEAYRSMDETRPLIVLGEVLDEGLLADLEATENVRFEGTVPHGSAIQYLANADLVVLPSREEALPRVALEAFVVGTPIICPPGVPEFEEYVSHLVLPEVSAAAIARKIEELSTGDDPTLEYPIERHYVDNTAESFVDLYDAHVE